MQRATLEQHDGFLLAVGQGICHLERNHSYLG